MTRPNIVYINSHDTGRHIQPYGHAVPTPNLQRLAEQGAMFRQAFCCSPSCAPSRAALLSGQYCHSNGMFGLSHPEPTLVDISRFRLHNPEHHILYTLRKAGYFTALAGTEHIVDLSWESQDTIGYDIQLGNRNQGELSAVEFLDNAPQQPFFLSCGFNETHRKFLDPGPDEDPRYCVPPPNLPDLPETREDMAAFKATARVLDAKMGKVFDALRRNNLEENTLVICTTDHGIPFPGNKGHVTDGGTGVFLIVKGPGGFDGGKVIDAQVMQIDIFPTICDLLEIESPEWLQGCSMMPLIHSETDEIHDAIFTELTYHRAYEPLRCIRTKRWKYVRRFDFTARGDANADPVSPSRDVWLAHGWMEDSDPQEETLYDLIFDPNETNNLVGTPRVAEIHNDLKTRLEQWMRETGDPLLDGPIPGPRGDFIHDRDRTD